MGWTPPTKITVVITFLLWIFGLFVLIDQVFLDPDSLLPEFSLGTFSSFETWILFAMIAFFLAWFLMFLGVKLKGL